MEGVRKADGRGGRSSVRDIPGSMPSPLAAGVTGEVKPAGIFSAGAETVWAQAGHEEETRARTREDAVSLAGMANLRSCRKILDFARRFFQVSRSYFSPG
jgi:hypothetical protein